MTNLPPVVETEEVLAELVALRRVGLDRAGVDTTPRLLELARATSGAPNPSSSDLERLLRSAIESIEVGMDATVLEASFGLTPGTRLWSSSRRRESAAILLERSAATVQRRYEPLLFKALADRLQNLTQRQPLESEIEVAVQPPASPGMTNNISGHVEKAVQVAFAKKLNVYLGDTTQNVVPHELPAPPVTLVGEASDLLKKYSAIDTDLISALIVAGAADVGTSALAISLAQNLRPQLGAGEIYIDFNGHGIHRVASSTAATTALRSLGIPEQAIPTEEDRRYALLRSILTQARYLVVLDNLADDHFLSQIRVHPSESLIIAAGILAPLNWTSDCVTIELHPLSATQGYAMARSILNVPEPENMPSLLERTLQLPGRIRRLVKAINELQLEEHAIVDPADLAPSLLSLDEAHILTFLRTAPIERPSISLVGNQTRIPQVRMQRAVARLAQLELVKLEDSRLMGFARNREEATMQYSPAQNLKGLAKWYMERLRASGAAWATLGSPVSGTVRVRSAWIRDEIDNILSLAEALELARMNRLAWELLALTQG